MGGSPPVSDRLGFLGRWDLRRFLNFLRTLPSPLSSEAMSSFEDLVEELRDFRELLEGIGVS